MDFINQLSRQGGEHQIPSVQRNTQFHITEQAGGTDAGLTNKQDLPYGKKESCMLMNGEANQKPAEAQNSSAKNTDKKKSTLATNFFLHF